MAYIVITTFILVLSVVNTGLCADSTFIKFNFNHNLVIEIPRNWTILDENINKQLNNTSEALAILNNIQLKNGDNNILVAANAYTSANSPSATLRLSVRPGNVPTQADMRSFQGLSKTEFKEIIDPVLAKTKLVLLSIEGTNSVKVVDAKVIQSKNMTCFYTELQADTNTGVKLLQSYICPCGDKTVKLATSYNKSEKLIFKPVIDYVWDSLAVR
jgi:hypothetical protein